MKKENTHVAHCCFYLPSMHSTATPQQPELLSSETSGSDTDEDLFGPPPSERSLWKNHGTGSLSRTADLWASSNRPAESSVRRGSDRELQAFISMRDQADQATEVTEKCWWGHKKGTMITTMCVKKKRWLVFPLSERKRLVDSDDMFYSSVSKKLQVAI